MDQQQEISMALKNMKKAAGYSDPKQAKSAGDAVLCHLLNVLGVGEIADLWVEITVRKHSIESNADDLTRV